MDSQSTHVVSIFLLGVLSVSLLGCAFRSKPTNGIQPSSPHTGVARADITDALEPFRSGLLGITDEIGKLKESLGLHKPTLHVFSKKTF